MTFICLNEKFDVVVFKSVLGSVARAGGRLSNAEIAQQVFDNLGGLLRPNGILMF